MNLPADAEMPVLLQYAAAANVLLGEYKVLDHEADSRRRHWTWIRRFFSPAFRKAQRDLRSFGFPVDQATEILARQSGLESAGVEVGQAGEPTAAVTALVFREGAQLAGLSEKADALADIGHRFGQLIYLIDAWEDFDRDARTGSFNALRASGVGRDWAVRRIREDGASLAATLDALGAPGEFALRLRSNIDARLGSPLRVLSSCSRQTFGMRWREALARTRAWKAPLLTFAFVALMAFLFPRHARLARSARECLSLGLNLMALGGLMAMALVPEPVAGPPRKRRIGSFCGGCDPGCNCCCDGCTDGCCDCCGEGCCDSCSGCCDCCSGCDCSC
jgi:hypothetical protein